MQQERIEIFPNSSQIAHSDKTAMSASLQGKNQQSNTMSEEGRPQCPCGHKYWPSQCYYLNPHRKIKPNWKINRETANKMEIYLQKNPKFAAEVDAAIKIWDQTRKLRSKTKTTEEANVTASYDEEEQHFAGTCLQAGSASNFSLFNFTILDSGTNVHILNDSMKHRIFEEGGQP